MLNLLPNQELDDIIYARRNTRLRHWIVIILFGLVGIVIMVGAGRIIIDRSTKQVNQQLAVDRERLKTQKVEEVQGRVEDISSSLKLATQVLSRQVILSKLIQQIATVLPSGTSLAGLQLNKVDGGMDLSVVATNYQAATQVQINLKDPANKLFEQADINNITCTGATDPKYPCSGSFRVLFADKNAYTFLGSGTTP